jgi:RND family efflux transporter MFP subunit
MMKTSTSVIVFGTAVMLLGLAGCSGGASQGIQPIGVKVQTATMTRDSKVLAYSGTIEAAESTPLSFGVNGTVSRVLVSEGDFVKKGQLLATLNDATLRNAYNMSKAMLDRSEDVYKRLKPMYDKGSLPEIKFVEVETGWQQAKAAAAISEKNLIDCNLYAPVVGYVGVRSIEPGMNVLPSITAISILSIDSVSARISVSEKEIGQIVKGGTSSITIAALGSDTLTGIISEIGVLADPIAHTYKIKITLPNPDKSIKPGMICEARIPIASTLSAVIVPNAAVRVDEQGKTFVFSINESQGTAIRKVVETGRLMDDGIEIRSGLTTGDRVVVAGQQKLVDNSPIQVMN